MRKLILLIIAASSCWGAVCTSRQNGNWNNKATWGTGSGCVGASALCSDGVSPCPGLGDTATVNHSVVQNVPNLIIGVNGAAPQYSYLQTLGSVGGGTGYTSCVISVNGGTPIRWGGAECAVVGGVMTPYITDRGWYSVCPTGVEIVGYGGGSGGTLTGTPTCPTGGGTPAITVNGSLTVSADTYVRGTLELESSGSITVPTALTISPGATLFMDMTQASGAMYGIINSSYGVKIYSDCTTSQCSIQGLGGVTIIDGLTGVDRTLVLVVKNVLFKNVGDANTIFGRTQDSWNGSTAILGDVENSIFDTCGTVFSNNPAALPYFGLTWIGNYHKNTPLRYIGDTSMRNLVTAPQSPLSGGGARVIQNNSFDAGVGAQLRDFTITGNVFSGGVAAQVAAGLEWASFQDNLDRWHTTDHTTSGQGLGMPGSMANTYFFADSVILANPHILTNQASTGTITNFIGSMSGRVTPDGQWFGAANTTIQNSLILCTANGGGMVLATGLGTGARTTVINHNTDCVRNENALMVNHTGFQPSGFLTFESNLVWNGSGSEMKIETIDNPGNLDMCSTTNGTTSNCDYNAGSGTGLTQTCSGCTNQGRGYGGLWSYTPGFHDVDGQNPRFVESGRKLENFDRGYLSKALSTQWVAGNTYGYGNLVSNSDATEYAGEPFNFRCINSAGCTASEAPGTGHRSTFIAGSSSTMNVDVTSLRMATVTPDLIGCSSSNDSVGVGVSSFSTVGSPYVTSVTFNYAAQTGVTCYVFSEWRANWEWASLYWLRELTYQKTKYTDGAIECSGCSAVQALNAWVRAGFVTQNPRYRGAGHDGKDIGAVQLPAVRRMFAGAVVP
jgi:hypothetical protein